MSYLCTGHQKTPYSDIDPFDKTYTALQKFGNTPGKVWFWTISA